MRNNITKSRLIALGWLAVFLASAFLTGETVATMHRFGLTGERPPLPAVQTILRILIVVAALALVPVFRGVLERCTLLMGAAAAGSSALFGFGLRSAGLSAFRLLSHLAAFALAMLVAGWRVAPVWPKQKAAGARQ